MNDIRSISDTTQATPRERILHSLVDSLPSMLGYWDKLQRNGFASRAYAEWFGVSPDKMAGMHIRDLLGEKLYSANLPYIEGALRGVPQEFERAIPLPDGKGMRHSLAQYIPDVVDGEVLGFFVHVIDIGHVKRANEALRQAEARFRDLFEYAPLPYQSLDADGCLLEVNLAWAQLFGYARDEVLGHNISEYLTDASRQTQALRLSRLKATGALSSVTMDIVSKDGQQRTVEITGNTASDPDGHLEVTHCLLNDITDRTRTEEALREQRDFSDSLIETAQAIILVLDTQGRIVRFNHYMEELTGYSLAEVKGKDWFETFIKPDEGSTIKAIFQKAVGDIQTRGNVHSVITKDGREILVEWYDKTLKDKNGRTVGLLAIGHDFTARKQTELALQEMQDFKQAILDAVSTQVAVVDRQGVIVEVNEAWRRFALENALIPGQLPCNVDVGTNYLDICRTAAGHSAEGAQKAAMGIQAVLDRRIPKYEQEYPCHAPHARRWFLMTVTPLSLEKGGAVASHHDISAPRLLAEELSASEARIRSIVRTAPVGIGLLVNRIFLEVNEAFTSMTGYAAEELIGHSARMLYPTEEDFEYVGQEKYRQIGERGIGRVETRFRTKDGRIIDIALSSAPVVPEDLTRGVIFTAQDITAIKHAEQERLAREASQRNILVREVHHRIKNHLQGVIGLIDHLKIRQPAAADALDAATAQISAIAVVHGLHSTTLSSEMRPHQLVLAIVDAVTRLSPVVIRCREDTDPSAVALQINERDIVAVALIINELVYNAIKHTATDGEIELIFGCRNSSFDIQVLNRPASLPPGFDFAADRALGTGLTLVASLLPRQGACLSFDQQGDAVLAHLTLSPPCAMAAPIGNDDKENKT